MKKLLLLVAAITLTLAGLANAQCSEGVNEIGIFWNNDCVDCNPCEYFTGGAISAYVMLLNSDRPGGVRAYEFELVNSDGSIFTPPENYFLQNYGFPPTALALPIDEGQPVIIAVGMGTPIPPTPCITLLTINMLVFGNPPLAWCFGVVSPSINPTVEGQMVYVEDTNPETFVQMFPVTGPGVLKMACINASDCAPVAIEAESWGSLKSLYR